MGSVLGRFVKVMTFTAVLAVLGPVLIVAALYFISGGSGLREDLSYEEHVVPVIGALVKWFGVMLLIGFVLFLFGMSKKFTVPFADRDAFITRMDDAAKSIRYRPKSREGNRLVYKPPVIQRLAEKIHVEVGDGQATVSAPWNLSGKLKKRLSQG